MHGHLKPIRVAFLGPIGTYSHQVKPPPFGCTAAETLSRLRSISFADVFNAVASKATHVGVVPQENSIFGSVIETYDALRARDVGFIQGEVVLEVQHCLLVRHGVKQKDIQTIKSHEQALGQCRGFLAKNFPSASLEKVASTAAAAEAVLTSSDSAAICSKLCATVFDGLETLFESIQDQNSKSSLPSLLFHWLTPLPGNFTRFYVISGTRDTELPPPPDPVPGKTRCLIRLSSRTDAFPAPAITQLLTALAIPVSRLDRRPQLENKRLFHDVYFAELGCGESDSDAWPADIERGIERVRASGGEADLLGIW
ncbi:Prephenate dehydratase-domain-containing protein [Mycena alexandri]|uniref:Prephenate dehydratase-domain-containing protein n=1 Tax=Mycena alexandri TaxID=1745969 RepID=A0AAD6TKC7_9AGAR|nr:Prephenate dehydratase-domain-containing protein [Mycena alexandri]